MPSLCTTVDDNTASASDTAEASSAGANINSAGSTSPLPTAGAVSVRKPKPKKNWTKAQLRKKRKEETRLAAPHSKEKVAQIAEDRKISKQLEISIKHEKEEAKKAAAAIPQLVRLQIHFPHQI
jgi:hypothetical protein